MNEWIGKFMRLRTLLRLVIFVFYGFGGVVSAERKYEPPTHCASDEYTYFSCRIKGKSSVASLCGRRLDSSVSPPEDFLVDYRYGRPGEVVFKYPETPVSINGNKFFGHHEKPYQGGYVSDEVSFYMDDVFHGIYVLDERDLISGSVMGKGQRASLCVAGSIKNSLWQFILSLPSSAKY